MDKTGFELHENVMIPSFWQVIHFNRETKTLCNSSHSHFAFELLSFKWGEVTQNAANIIITINTFCPLDPNVRANNDYNGFILRCWALDWKLPCPPLMQSHKWLHHSGCSLRTCYCFDWRLFWIALIWWAAAEERGETHQGWSRLLSFIHY